MVSELVFFLVETRVVNRFFICYKDAIFNSLNITLGLRSHKESVFIWLVAELYI